MSMQDVSIKFDTQDDNRLITSPKAGPDGKNYGISDYLEKFTNTFFIASNVPIDSIGFVHHNTRFVVLVSKTFESKYQNIARVGKNISLIGRYEGNKELTLVAGGSITVPVFEIVYLN